MEEFLKDIEEKIVEYVSEKYDMSNVGIYLLDPEIYTYNKSISKFHKEMKKVKDSCSHLSEDMIPIIVKVKDLDSVSIDKSMHFYFCSECKRYILHTSINTSSLEAILLTNSLSRNLHVNDLEKKKLTCMRKIKRNMMYECRCQKEEDTQIIKRCSRCSSLQQQLTKLATLEVQMELQNQKMKNLNQT